jgi:hypothetical protein
MKILLAAVDLFCADGRTDGRTVMDRYGEANYCAVDGAGHLECVTVVGRWSARVGCVVDSRVCLQTSFC